MKNRILILFTFLFFAFALLIGCSKEKPFDNPTTATTDSTEIKKAQIDTCANPVSKGRIIGISMVMNFFNFDTSRFVKYDKSLGPGYLIEIDNGSKKDTAITYRMTYNNFQLNPSMNNVIDFYYLFLFKPQYQDSLKINFNYRTSIEKTEVYASSNSWDNRLILWLNFIKDKKEIIVSCVAPQ